MGFRWDMGESRDHAECGESNNGVKALSFIVLTHWFSARALITFERELDKWNRVDCW